MSKFENKKLVMSRRSRIENAHEVAEEERRKKLLSQRLDLARSGIQFYREGKVTDAIRSFHSYIRILEEVKNVGEGELFPSCFDLKRDLPELLMISGVYWDLAKTYDHTKTPEKQQEFHHYLEKYIIFSKGMPYQALCSETLRKHLQMSRPTHRAEFKNAYETLKKTRCFIASSLVDVTAPETLPSLRLFRDSVLRKSPTGRTLVYLYYQKSPKLAKRLNQLPNGIRKILGGLLDLLAKLAAKWTPSLAQQSPNPVRPESKLAIRKTGP